MTNLDNQRLKRNTLYTRYKISGTFEVISTFQKRFVVNELEATNT